ncbi:DUF402 domain-containing protein [Candidatus Parcubacteria bacterium]|nr:MAG: DUF402 domain-containing protein [Candidatus Parcubacteria bacterium]
MNLRTTNHAKPPLIHPPGYKKSNIPIGNPNNPMQENKLSENTLITTEIWDESIPQPWSFSKKNNNKSKKFRLIMTWELGKTYAQTKVLDEKDALIYYYIDICSPIKNKGNVFEFQDWYLDIIKRPNQSPVLLDEKEFEQALNLGYLNQKDEKLARKTLNKIMNKLQTKNQIKTILF